MSDRWLDGIAFYNGLDNNYPNYKISYNVYSNMMEIFWDAFSQWSGNVKVDSISNYIYLTMVKK